MKRKGESMTLPDLVERLAGRKLSEEEPQILRKMESGPVRIAPPIPRWPFDGGGNARYEAEVVAARGRWT